MFDGHTITIYPGAANFVINVDMKENFAVKAIGWEPLITKIFDSLASGPRIESINLNVTWETAIRTAGQLVPPTTPAVVNMTTDNFGRLRGVAHATVSGLGADPCEALVAKITQKPVTETR